MSKYICCLAVICQSQSIRSYCAACVISALSTKQPCQPSSPVNTCMFLQVNAPTVAKSEVMLGPEGDKQLAPLKVQDVKQQGLWQTLAQLAPDNYIVYNKAVQNLGQSHLPAMPEGSVA